MKNLSNGFIQIPVLIIFFVSAFLLSGAAGFVLYKKGKLPFISKDNNAVRTAKILHLNTTSGPSITQKPQQKVLGENESRDEIIKPSPTSNPTLQPINQLQTYSIVPLGDTSGYSAGERTVLNNAYNEFLQIPSLKYMDYQTQNQLLDQIVRRYIAQYKLELEKEIQQAKENLAVMQKALTPTSSPAPATPTQVTIYVNSEIEAKLAELRQTLENIQNQPVPMNVIQGRTQEAYRNWIKNNPEVYSAILGSRYINDLNAILRAYGL